jgi:hypothetical protein
VNPSPWNSLSATGGTSTITSMPPASISAVRVLASVIGRKTTA